MNFEFVTRKRPPAPVPRPQNATDGAIRMPEAEVQRALADAGTTLQGYRVPEGILLASPDLSPQKVYVELTTDCNLDCRMCPRSSWEQPGGKMTKATFKRVVRQLSELASGATVNFSGYGEPMTHPRFFEFLGQTKKAGLSAEVVTNGTFLDRKVCRKFIDTGLDKLIVSIDGVSSSSTEGLHSGTFSQVAERLRTLNLMRVKRGVTHPVTALEFVATKRNIHELPLLKSHSPDLGFTSILVTNLVPSTPELSDEILYERWNTVTRPLAATPWTPCIDLPQMDLLSDGGPVFEDLHRTGTHLRINGKDAAGAGPYCRFVNEGRLAIRWDGNVSPCLPLMHTQTYYFRHEPKRFVCHHVGNVNEQSLAEIWNDAEYRSFRDRVRRFEFSPCIDCGGCDLRESNESDCFGDAFPRCGECLWAHGLVQCP